MNSFKCSIYLLKYCDSNNINIDVSKDDPTYSIDENLLHTSYEGGVLEDLSNEAPKDIWKRTKDIEETPDTREEITIQFSN